MLSGGQRRKADFLSKDSADTGENHSIDFRSAQALLTLTLPSAQAAQSYSCPPFLWPIMFYCFAKLVNFYMIIFKETKSAPKELK